MNSDEDYLQLLYGSLRNTMQANAKVKRESLLMAAIEMTANTRLDLLKKSALGQSLLGSHEVEALIKRGLVMESADPGRFALTGKGIWHVESASGTFTEAKFVDFLDEKFFPRATGATPPNDKDKVVLLGFAAARCFGPEQAMDLHTTDSVKERWAGVFLAAYDFLKENGGIAKATRDKLFGTKEGNEHRVSNFVRHTDYLPPKTRGIYKSLGSQRYCLDVVENSEIDVQRLAHIFRLIMGANADPVKLEALVGFCGQIANDQGIYLHDLDKATFFGARYDDIMRRAIMNAGGLA